MITDCTMNLLKKSERFKQSPTIGDPPPPQNTVRTVQMISKPRQNERINLITKKRNNDLPVRL
jgi:hypothetical protein